MLEELNSQGQPMWVWPETFALARAYVDQLERHGGLSASRIADVRSTLDAAESQSGSARRDALGGLTRSLLSDAERSVDADRVRMLARTVRGLMR